MNRRAARDAQLALPGLAPLCPHCGARRTELLRSGAQQEVVSGEEWRCNACGRGFWSLPSLAATATRTRRA